MKSGLIEREMRNNKSNVAQEIADGVQLSNDGYDSNLSKPKHIECISVTDTNANERTHGQREKPTTREPIKRPDEDKRPDSTDASEHNTPTNHKSPNEVDAKVAETSGKHVGSAQPVIPSQDDKHRVPILLTIRVGEVYAEIDIANCIPMANRENRKRDPPGYEDRCRQTHNGEHDDCVRRMNGQDKRIDNLEDVIDDKMRKLRIRNDELTDELRDVKRRLADSNNMRNIIVGPMNHERYETRCMSLGILTDTMHDEAPQDDQIQVRREADNTRPRAASFAGTLGRGYDGTRPKRGNNAEKQHTMVSSGDRRESAPKPQREKEREKRSTGTRAKNQREPDDAHAKDNPLKDWLHRAKKDSVTTQETPIPNRQPRSVELSPSWADDDDYNDDDYDTSGTATPTQTPPGAPMDAAADLHGPPREIDNPTRSIDHYDDVYKLPPSGQVTERKARQREQGPKQKTGPAKNFEAKQSTRGKIPNESVKNGNNKPNDKKDGKNGPGNRNRKQNGKGEMSYANAAKKGEWKTQQSKKRKFEKVSPKASFPLKGIPTTVNRDIYLQGLDVRDRNDEELIESVRSYCLNNNVEPTFIRLIPVRYDFTRTGCRLTVRERDFSKVVRNTFWPDNIKAREWTAKPRDNQNNGVWVAGDNQGNREEGSDDNQDEGERATSDDED